MTNKYKTGIFHWFGYILPFEERIKLIKQKIVWKLYYLYEERLCIKNFIL